MWGLQDPGLAPPHKRRDGCSCLNNILCHNKRRYLKEIKSGVGHIEQPPEEDPQSLINKAEANVAGNAKA